MALKDQVVEYLQQGYDISFQWITSAAAWSQFGLLVATFLAAYYARKKLAPVVETLLTPSEKQTGMFAQALRFGLLFLPLLLPLLAYALTAVGEQITRSLFGSGAVIAFGKRLFILLAVRILVRDIVHSPFLKVLGKYILLPLTVLYALGLFDTTSTLLANTNIGVGNISFSLLAIARGVIFGGVIFWIGRWSNDRGVEYIRAQEDLRIPTRELATKSFELLVFGGCFLLLMNILGLNLSALAFIGGAVGVGVGFGLQKIAANFISGIILLLEGQATVGDYVELDGGHHTDCELV